MVCCDKRGLPWPRLRGSCQPGVRRLCSRLTMVEEPCWMDEDHRSLNGCVSRSAELVCLPVLQTTSPAPLLMNANWASAGA